MPIEFASVTVSFFVHSTEDESRMVSDVSKALEIAKDSIEVEKLQGHHGNTLYSAKAHIVGNEANIVSKHILTGLESASKNSVASDLEKSVDEHDALYLRLDRQVLGQKLALSSEEPVRVKLKPKNTFENRQMIRRRYLELLRS